MSPELSKPNKQPFHILAFIIGLAILFRCLAATGMMATTILFETRAAPKLPDLIIDNIKFYPWIDKWDMTIWIVIYLLGCAFLLSKHPRRFARFMITDGILSIIRAFTVILTGMGPIKSEDFLQNSTLEQRLESIKVLLNPVNAFFSNELDSHMTKDMFFSGHVAASFMLLLYLWPILPARIFMIIGHIIIVLTVFFGHLHYSIDVVAAYAFALSLFFIRESSLKQTLNPPNLPADTWN